MRPDRAIDVIRPTCHLLSRIHEVETVSRPVSRTLETIVAMRVLTMRSGRSVQVSMLASTSDVARLLPTLQLVSVPSARSASS